VLGWLRAARRQAIDSYLPGGHTVRDSCLDDLAACDLYVLVLCHRYGFQSADGNPDGLAITQLEFRRAGECGIPRVALLRTRGAGASRQLGREGPPSRRRATPCLEGAAQVSETVAHLRR
jgi:Domain of unknown function (DUF4062)